jgi:hypothetical protein
METIQIAEFNFVNGVSHKESERMISCLRMGRCLPLSVNINAATRDITHQTLEGDALRSIISNCDRKVIKLRC